MSWPWLKTRPTSWRAATGGRCSWKRTRTCSCPFSCQKTAIPVTSSGTSQTVYRNSWTLCAREVSTLAVCAVCTAARVQVRIGCSAFSPDGLRVLGLGRERSPVTRGQKRPATQFSWVCPGPPRALAVRTRCHGHASAGLVGMTVGWLFVSLERNHPGW